MKPMFSNSKMDNRRKILVPGAHILQSQVDRNKDMIAIQAEYDEVVNQRNEQSELNQVLQAQLSDLQDRHQSCEKIMKDKETQIIQMQQSAKEQQKELNKSNKERDESRILLDKIFAAQEMNPHQLPNMKMIWGAGIDELRQSLAEITIQLAAAQVNVKFDTTVQLS